jgi:hypothetical protein
VCSRLPGGANVQRLVTTAVWASGCSTHSATCVCAWSDAGMLW